MRIKGDGRRKIPLSVRPYIFVRLLLLLKITTLGIIFTLHFKWAGSNNKSKYSGLVPIRHSVKTIKHLGSVFLYYHPVCGIYSPSYKIAAGAPAIIFTFQPR